MGIRKKIYVGFVIIGFILFLSGIISVFQLMSMEKTISGMLSDNVKSVELARRMTDVIENHTWEILDVITHKKTGDNARIEFNDQRLEQLIANTRENLTAEGESEVIESLETSYNAYYTILTTIDSLFARPDLDNRMAWFVNLYQPAYLQFNAAIQKLRAINQNALFDNSKKLEDGSYRMLMPPIIAIIVGLLLIIMYNYFLNIYFINPVLRINKGIKLFLENKKPYTVKVETNDEINSLNESINTLISKIKKESIIK